MHRQCPDHEPLSSVFLGVWGFVSHLKLRYGGGSLAKGLSNKTRKALLNSFGSTPPPREIEERQG